MARQTKKTETVVEPGDPKRSREKIKAEIVDLQGRSPLNGKEISSWEKAVLDLTRAALDSSLDDFAEELPLEKQVRVEKLKNGLKKEVAEPGDRNFSPEMKLKIVRIEIDHEIARVKKSREETKREQNADVGNGQKSAVKNKKYKRVNPYNINQVMLRKTLI